MLEQITLADVLQIASSVGVSGLAIYAWIQERAAHGETRKAARAEIEAVRAELADVNAEYAAYLKAVPAKLIEFANEQRKTVRALRNGGGHGD